eukprot:9061402-Heterocapsa_arctica.AAC.1
MGSKENQLSIMAMGFICTRLDRQFESHAYCMRQNYPDKHTNDKDGISAERYRLHESNTDKGVNSSRRTDCLLVSKTDKHYSR